MFLFVQGHLPPACSSFVRVKNSCSISFTPVPSSSSFSAVLLAVFGWTTFRGVLGVTVLWSDHKVFFLKFLFPQSAIWLEWKVNRIWSPYCHPNSKSTSSTNFQSVGKFEDDVRKGIFLLSLVSLSGCCFTGWAWGRQSRCPAWTFWTCSQEFSPCGGNSFQFLPILGGSPISSPTFQSSLKSSSQVLWCSSIWGLACLQGDGARKTGRCFQLWPTAVSQGWGAWRSWVFVFTGFGGVQRRRCCCFGRCGFFPGWRDVEAEREMVLLGLPMMRRDFWVEK